MFKYFILLLIFIFTACESTNSIHHVASVEGDIIDTKSWYDDSSVNILEINVNIPIPNTLLCTAYDDIGGVLRPCTLNDINHDTDILDTYVPTLDVVMSTSNFLLSNELSNATMKLRGDYSRTLAQKSYAIKLNSKTELFEKQRKFQFNKHQSDRSRVKNKLAFDLFRSIPNITSIKTQFVHLKIDDTDYGLFTHAEAMREEFLVNRGWNKDDNLYNAVGCFFEVRDELEVDVEGAPLNSELFDTILEIKNGKNHAKVAQLMKAINSDTDIDEVIAKYFNRQNYITWMAINLILSDKDTTYHNYYLYNPVYSDVFYFMPWDYDGAWATQNFLGKSEYGISVWWESVLHRKFLTKKKNRDDVYAMAEEIRAKYITDEKIKALTDSYRTVVKPYINQLPDSENNSEVSWDEATKALASDIDINIALYKSVIGHPMPFREFAKYNNGLLTLSWNPSIDLEGDEIVYDVTVASDVNFKDKVLFRSHVTETFLNENIELSNGIYYLKVLSKELQNEAHYQIAFDQIDSEGRVYYGVLEFEVK